MTTNNSSAVELARIDDAAAAWAARRLSGDFTKRDQVEFDAWLAADARHAPAVREYLAIADQSALAAAAAGKRSAANDSMDRGRPLSRRRWLIAGPAIAASLAAALVLSSVVDRGAPVAEQYATAKGDTLNVDLPDGSVVTLNTDTAITVSFEADRRIVSLDRGEAFFDVAHDKSAPFVVEADNAEVTVLGTSFTLRSAIDRAIICVHDGTVAVKPQALSKRGSLVRLGAGEQVAINDSGEASQIREFAPSEAATWRRGYLMFDQTPLSNVIEEVNRYFETQITLGDPALGDAPVSGRIEISDQAVAVRALSVALSLQAEVDDSFIVLKSDD